MRDVRKSKRSQRRDRHRRRVAWLGIVCVLSAPFGCRTRDAAARRGVKPVQIRNLDGYLEYTFRERRRNQNSKTASGNLDYRETIQEEAIQLEAEGYVYHPNFLEFTLAGLFGLTQQDFEQTADGRRTTSSDSGDRYEFDFTGLFFQKKNYPGSVYARRHRAIEPRPFQSSLVTTTTSYGFVWQYVDLKMPTSIQFNDTDVRIDPLDPKEDNGRHKTTQFRIDTAYKFAPDNTLSFWYQYRDETEEPFNFNFTTHEYMLTHKYNFGDKHQYELDSEINLFKQTGSFDIDRVRWREMFKITHSEDLDSWYRFEIIDRKQGNLAGVAPIKERSWLLMGTVEQRTYDSLVTEINGWVQNQNFGSLEIRRYGAQANLDYRKKDPLGVLHASYRARFVSERRRGDNQPGEAFEERGTFKDPDPVELNSTAVILSSISVASEDRITRYVEGRDYRVVRLGDVVQLERIPTGRIADGDTVLITYQFEVVGDSDLETAGMEAFVEHEFDFGLKPYYRFQWQDQTLKPGDAVGITPNDITAHTIGAEYKKGPLRLTAEYEDYDSTISPYRATRLGADLNYRFASGAATSLKARWTDRRQSDPSPRTTRFLTVEGLYRHNITRTLYVEGSALYRKQNDSISDNFEGVDIDLSLEWTVRTTEMRVTYEWSTYNGLFAQNDASSLYVRVRRRF